MNFRVFRESNQWLSHGILHTGREDLLADLGKIIIIKGLNSFGASLYPVVYTILANQTHGRRGLHIPGKQ